MASRIPETIHLFNGYINTTANYIIAGGPPDNGTRLGLSGQNMDDWKTKRVYWRDTLYPKYQDPNQCTPAVKDETHKFIASFKTFGQPLLNIMAVSPAATDADAHAFNFVLERHAPTTPTASIKDGVAIKTTPLGGGDLDFSCRTSHDDHRASKADGADSLQLAFAIVDGGNMPMPGPGMPMPNPNDTGMTKEIFTKALFVFHCGPQNVGKRLIAFGRWYNTKHPELAGPWTDIIIVVIA